MLQIKTLNEHISYFTILAAHDYHPYGQIAAGKEAVTAIRQALEEGTF